jgi:hypothetical protein
MTKHFGLKPFTPTRSDPLNPSHRLVLASMTRLGSDPDDTEPARLKGTAITGRNSCGISPRNGPPIRKTAKVHK